MNRISQVQTVLVLMLVTSVSLAETKGFEMNFDLTRAGVNGEPRGIEYLRGCVDESTMCALAAGTGLQHSGRNDEAIELFQRALAEGEGLGASALAFLHLEAKEFKQAYSWARLAMEIVRRKRNLTRTELLRNQNAFMAAAAIQAMKRSQHDAAEEHAMRLLHEWEHILAAASNQQAESQPDYEVVKRSAPRYPRSLAASRVEGTVYLHARVNERGNVTETIPIYFTHRPFAQEAERAFRKWKIEFDASDHGDTTRNRTLNQLIDFSLQRE